MALPDTSPTPDSHTPYPYFTKEGQSLFAGKHLLIDLWGAKQITNAAFIEATLIEAALAAHATILHTHFHVFDQFGGISGVVVLAESHISIHTWPESGYTAIDIFMCATCNPHLALPVLEAAFQPETITVQEIRRGIVR